MALNPMVAMFTIALKAEWEAWSESQPQVSGLDSEST